MAKYTGLQIKPPRTSDRGLLRINQQKQAQEKTEFKKKKKNNLQNKTAINKWRDVEPSSWPGGV